MENKGIAIFENRAIRRVWHDEEWWFSVVDIIEVLTESNRSRKYWSDLKIKLISEGCTEVSEKIGQFKLAAPDGKKRETDCANVETIFRIIQSIPSPKAEPFKLWLAKIGKERLDEIKNPMLAMERMKAIYEQKGYPKSWIEKYTRISKAYSAKTFVII